MTIEQLFNEKAPAVLKDNADKLKVCAGSIYNLKITGPGGGDWSLNMTLSPAICTPGASQIAQCTVEVDSENFKRLLVQPMLGMQLYFQGKLKVTGNPILLQKLQPLFALLA